MSNDFPQLKKPEKCSVPGHVTYWVVNTDNDFEYLVDNLDDDGNELFPSMVDNMTNILLKGYSWSFNSECAAHRAAAKYYWSHKENYPYAEDFADSVVAGIHDPTVNNTVESTVMEFV